MLIKVLEDQYVNENESLSTSIKVTSKFDVHVTWYLNEEKLAPGENVVLTYNDSEKVSTLVVNRVPPEYAGKLTAEAQNKAGSTSTTCAIHVNSMYNGCLMAKSPVTIQH